MPQHIAHHRHPDTFGDKFAFRLVKSLRFIADAFFANRYGHRAVVLETVAAVPGMVGGAMLHLKSLRRLCDDQGWIETLLDEAANERMHLMTFVEIARPTTFERFLIIAVQCIFYIAYLLLYLLSPKTAHRVVGYLEEEAVTSYTQYLDRIENGEIENIPAPQIAVDYWRLDDTARLSDLVRVIRADEATHREMNHCIADKIAGKDCALHIPDDTRQQNREKLETSAQRGAP